MNASASRSVRQTYFQTDLTYQVAQERAQWVSRLASMSPAGNFPWTVRAGEEAPIPPSTPGSLPGNIIILPIRKTDSDPKAQPSLTPKGPAKVVVFPSHRSEFEPSRPPSWPSLGT